eukprot:PhM_4_TR15886/c3_g1_i1/m.16972
MPELPFIRYHATIEVWAAADVMQRWVGDGSTTAPVYTGTNTSIRVGADTVAVFPKATVKAMENVAMAASLAGGGAGATAGAKLAAVLDSLQCPSEDWRDEVDDDVEWQDHLTRGRIGDPSNPHNMSILAGMSVYNIIVAAGFVVVHGIVALVVGFRMHRFRVERAFITMTFPPRLVDTLYDGMAATHFPSFSLFPVLFVYQAGVSASLKVALYSNEESLRSLCSFMFFLYVFVFPSGVLWLVLSPTTFHAQYEVDEGASVWTRLLSGRGYWVDARPGGDDTTHAHFEVGRLEGSLRSTAFFSPTHYCARFGLFFDAFTGRCRWFVLADIATALSLGILTAVEPSTLGGCVRRQIVMTVVFVVFTAAVVVLRPYNAHWENIFFAVTGGLQAAACSLILVAQATDSVEGRAASAGVVIMFGVGMLFLVRSGFDVVVLVFTCMHREGKEGVKIRGDDDGDDACEMSLLDAEEAEVEEMLITKEALPPSIVPLINIKRQTHTVHPEEGAGDPEHFIPNSSERNRQQPRRPPRRHRPQNNNISISNSNTTNTTSGLHRTTKKISDDDIP